MPAATNNFAPPSVRLLIDGGSYSRVTTSHMRAMIDTAAHMCYICKRTYAGQLFEGGSYFSAQALRVATIRGQLDLLLNVQLYII